MTDLTIVMAVYGQPLTLARQVEAISSYHEVILNRLHVVIVDDCGEPPASVGHLPVKSLKVFRVERDIPWNQPGARNLGVLHSSGWCLLIDPDMVFSCETMARLMQAAEKLPRGHASKLALRHARTGKLDTTGPNTWLIHRDDFMAVGGYDEDYAGHKGWSDVQLLDVLKAHYTIVKRPDLWADFLGNDVIPDAAVTSLDRSVDFNYKIRLRKASEAQRCGGWKQWIKKHKGPNIRFPWVPVT